MEVKITLLTPKYINTTEHRMELTKVWDRGEAQARLLTTGILQNLER